MEVKAKMDCAELFAIADFAGTVAAKSCEVAAMVVTERANALDDSSAVKKAWICEGGVCGFAWVKVKGNCAMARWLKKYKGARKGYYGGTELWVRGYGQSMSRKEAYAEAFAEVLRANGVTAYAGSRMD